MPLRAKKSGVSGTDGGPVGPALLRLRAEGRLHLTDDDIDLLRRAASWFSEGELTAVETQGEAVLSLGFLGWTRADGRLPAWADAAEEAFARHGVGRVGDGLGPVGPGRGQRADAWGRAVAAASLEDEAVVAEVHLALEVALPERLADLERRVERKVPGGWVAVAPYLDASPPVRALAILAHADHPSAAGRGLRHVARARLGGGAPPDDRVAAGALGPDAGYASRDARKQGRRLVRRVLAQPLWYPGMT